MVLWSAGMAFHWLIEAAPRNLLLAFDVTFGIIAAIPLPVLRVVLFVKVKTSSGLRTVLLCMMDHTSPIFRCLIFLKIPGGPLHESSNWTFLKNLDWILHSSLWSLTIPRGWPSLSALGLSMAKTPTPYSAGGDTCVIQILVSREGSLLSTDDHFLDLDGSHSDALD